MTFEWRTDMLHPSRVLGFYTSEMDKHILRPAAFAAVDSLNGQGPWRPEKSA
jgi:hypothetical protein